MKANSTTEIEFPETLQEAMKYFAGPDVAFDYMKSIRWPDGVVTCPRCGSDKVSFISTRKLWTCKDCKTKKQFTIKVGTIMEDSPLSYETWICGFWLIANAKNGISSYELHRSLGITQKSAWFMLHRIRLCLQQGSLVKIGGKGKMVEVDETFIGGLSRNMHMKRRLKKFKGTGGYAKTAVQGLLERNEKGCSKVVTKVVRNVRRETLQPNIRKHVARGTMLLTDAHVGYNDVAGKRYYHEVIDHAKAYVRGHVHTNGLENFWSLLKRSIKGTYVNVEPFHLFRYLDEQAFRFNERKDQDGDKGRFITAIKGIIGKGLTWAQLTGKDAQAGPLPA